MEQAIVKGIFEASGGVVRLLLRSTAGPGLPLGQSYFVRLVESAEVSECVRRSHLPLRMRDGPAIVVRRRISP